MSLSYRDNDGNEQTIAGTPYDKLKELDEKVDGLVKIINKSTTVTFNAGLGQLHDNDITPNSIVITHMSTNVETFIGVYNIPANGVVNICARNWSSGWVTGSITFFYSIIKVTND